MITSTQRDLLIDVITRMRIVAEPVGPLHAWWDDIFDCEAIIKGATPQLTEWKGSPDRAITECEHCLAEHHWQQAKCTAKRLGVPYEIPQPGPFKS